MSRVKKQNPSSRALREFYLFAKLTGIIIILSNNRLS